MNSKQRTGLSLGTLLVTLSGVALLLLTFALRADAQGATTLTTGSGTIASPGVGQTTTTTVSVVIDAADGGTMDSFQVKFGFDPSVVNVQSVALWARVPDPFEGWTGFLGPPQWNNTLGTLTVNGLFLVSDPSHAKCDSPCTLFSITWVGMAPGSSPITDQSTPPLVLLNAGDALTYNYSGGTVTVNGPATATNTNTPVNTATNTPVGTATNTPVGATATNTAVGTSTNTPVGTSTATTPAGTATATGTLTPPSGSATASTTNTPTRTATSTPGPLKYKVYAIQVAADSAPHGSQLLRDEADGLLDAILGDLLGLRP